MTGLILGISAYYHDSAAALVSEGIPIAAAQEERLSRRRHDPAFPEQAVRYCLREAGAELGDLDAVAYYEDPAVKFRRVMATYVGAAPTGYQVFRDTLPEWLFVKSRAATRVRDQLRRLGRGPMPKVECRQHHESHAMSAFLPCPYDSAAVLWLDGVRCWATTCLWHGPATALRQVAE